MSNKRMEFFLGVMVVTVFITVIVMTVLFGSSRKVIPGRGGEKMTIVFDKAPGIGNNSRVLKCGVEIGRVYKSELVDAEDKSEVHVFFKLDPGVNIYSNEIARINRTILGDAAIEFVKNPNYSGPITLRTSGDSINGVPGGDLMGTVSNIEGDLAKTIQSINKAADEMTTFIGNLNDFIGTPEEIDLKKSRLEATFRELNETLITTRSLATNLDAIVGNRDIQANVKKITESVPDLLSKVDGLIGNANILADDFHETILRSQDTFDNVGKNLDNLQAFTSSLSKDGPEFLSAINESGAQIRELVTNINEFTTELNRGIHNKNTPLGMISDEEAGISLRNTIKDIGAVSETVDDLVQDVHRAIPERIYPILDDARTFTNKIAHKPSLLVWGGNTYKGSSPISGRHSCFQSLSPTGGMNRSLYTNHLTAANQALLEKTSELRNISLNGEKTESAPVEILENPDSYYTQFAQNPEQYGQPMFPCLGAKRNNNDFGSYSAFYGDSLDQSIQDLANAAEKGNSGCCSRKATLLACAPHRGFSLGKLCNKFFKKEEPALESGFPEEHRSCLKPNCLNRQDQEYIISVDDPYTLDSWGGNGVDDYAGYYGEPIYSAPAMLDSGFSEYSPECYGSDCGIPSCAPECGADMNCSGFSCESTAMLDDGMAYEINGRRGGRSMANAAPKSMEFDSKDFQSIGLNEGGNNGGIPELGGNSVPPTEIIPAPYPTPPSQREDISVQRPIQTPRRMNPDVQHPSRLPEGMMGSNPRSDGFVDDGLPMLYMPNGN